MVKLKWDKDFQDKVQEYYYDFKTRKIYIFYPEDNIRRRNIVAWTLISFTGVIVTIERAILGKIRFPLTSENMMLCVIIAVIGCWLVSTIYDDAEKRITSMFGVTL